MGTSHTKALALFPPPDDTKGLADALAQLPLPLDPHVLGFLQSLALIFQIGVDVALRGADLPMPQHFLCKVDVAARGDNTGRGGVTKIVNAERT